MVNPTNILGLICHQRAPMPQTSHAARRSVSIEASCEYKDTLVTNLCRAMQSYWFRLAPPFHSPTCAAACPGWRTPQELPLQSVGGREEVSLCPRIIVTV